jgi:cobalt transporter subunit CbtB
MTALTLGRPAFADVDGNVDATREPGDLPFAPVESRTFGRNLLPKSLTEVVMSAKTQTLSLTDRIGARTVAGLMALVVGSILVFGVGLANSQTLHDAAHDTRHSYGFPCH